MIDGLKYLPDFLNAECEQQLLTEIDGRSWLGDLKRRVQHYGYKYDYRARIIDTSMFLGPLPGWAQSLASDLQKQKVFPNIPDQLIVNEYRPGQGISAHVDCEPCFGDVIASITLGSGCTMDFTRVYGHEKFSQHLEPRSLVVMTGEARYAWKHAIPPRKTDLLDGRRIARGRRVSLTFRTVLLESAS